MMALESAAYYVIMLLLSAECEGSTVRFNLELWNSSLTNIFGPTLLLLLQLLITGLPELECIVELF